MTSILESKFGSLIDTELPGIFTDTCFKLRSLEESRIVEKLARPISLISKMELMDAANAILLQVQAEL